MLHLDESLFFPDTGYVIKTGSVLIYPIFMSSIPNTYNHYFHVADNYQHQTTTDNRLLFLQGAV
jgi:hypothetical protein